MWSFFRHPNYYKKIYIFFSSSVRISEKNMIFDDKKISKSNFYKNKKLFGIYDVEVDKILISKKESYDKKAHLNTFLDIMMMMSSDHYV